jgi:hypothetical protein
MKVCNEKFPKSGHRIRHCAQIYSFPDGHGTIDPRTDHRGRHTMLCCPARRFPHGAPATDFVPHEGYMLGCVNWEDAARRELFGCIRGAWTAVIFACVSLNTPWPHWCQRGLFFG